MLNDYLYATDGIADHTKTVVILPEIYGLKPFAKQLADRCSRELFLTGYAFDYFYALTGEPNDLDYQTGVQRGMELMGQMTGEKYVELFTKVVELIQQRQPQLTELTVMGFCFGGRLAYLSGVNRAVTRIVSFYGAGSNGHDFYQSYSAIESLANERRHDYTLKVLGLFGESDESIPETDRQLISQRLTQAGISTQIKVYPAGHAFFNADRPDRYVEPAAVQAWADVKAWLS